MATVGVATPGWRARARATATSRLVSAWRPSPPARSARWASASGSAVGALGVEPLAQQRARSPRASSGWRRNSVERDSSGALTSKYGFSVVAPTSTSSPLSTDGSRASCCDLLNRCTSSRNRIVPWPRSPSRCSALATISRTSFTLADTAESCS